MRVIRVWILILLLTWPVFLWGTGLIDATALAAFLALVLGVLGNFKEEFISAFKRPELNFELRLEPPVSHKTPVRFFNDNEGHGSYPAYYLRLLVNNYGNLRAENIEVLLMEKSVKTEEGFTIDKSFLPLNFVWSHTREVTKKSIAPNLFKYCDFGHISHPDYSQIEGGKHTRTYLFFDFETRPNTKTHILEPGIYRFKIVLTADNANSVTKVIEFNFSGRWNDDETKMLNSCITATEIG